MPIIAQWERRLHKTIMSLNRSQFCEMLTDADDLALEWFKKGIRKFLMLGMTIPDYLDLLSEREEHILDTLSKKNRLSVSSLYNSLDDSSSEALFLLWFRWDVQYFVAQEYSSWLPLPPITFSPNDSDLSL